MIQKLKIKSSLYSIKIKEGSLHTGAGSYGLDTSNLYAFRDETRDVVITDLKKFYFSILYETEYELIERVSKKLLPSTLKTNFADWAVEK